MNNTETISAGHSGRRKPILDDWAFSQIAEIAHQEAGLAIAPSKAAMVHTRLARRLRALNLDSYQEYCALIESDAGKAERKELISALTTNVSHFFREDHHFDRLRTEILPELHNKIHSGQRVRIWSAGCSNGQEPYSIATTLLERGPLPPNADIKILATDIDPKVISFAETGIYDEIMIAGLPEPLKAAFFTPVDKGTAEAWQAKKELKDLITFRVLNLLHPWPMKGRFDIIFCRNVVIYFDEGTQEKLWEKFATVLHPGAWLFLGHSERVSQKSVNKFPSVGMTTYRRAEMSKEYPQNTLYN